MVVASHSAHISSVAASTSSWIDSTEIPSLAIASSTCSSTFASEGSVYCEDSTARAASRLRKAYPVPDSSAIGLSG
jgi:hypothetical protein